MMLVPYKANTAIAELVAQPLFNVTEAMGIDSHCAPLDFNEGFMVFLPKGDKVDDTEDHKSRPASEIRPLSLGN